MASAAELALKQAESNLKDLIATKYTTISAITFLLYDMILQFPQEYRLVWAARYNPLKYAYSFNRYLVFRVLCHFTYCLTAPPQYLDDTLCRTIPLVIGIVGSSSFAISNGLIFVSVLVFWRRAVSIRVVVFSGFFACYAVGLSFLAMTVHRSYSASYFNTSIGACVIALQPKLFIGFWVPNLILDVYAFSLILMSLDNRPVGLESTLRYVYYDSIRYSVIVASFKLGMIIVASFDIIALNFVLLGFEMSLLVTVGARILFKLYSAGDRNDDEDHFSPDATLIELHAFKRHSLAQLRSDQVASIQINLVKTAGMRRIIVPLVND